MSWKHHVPTRCAIHVHTALDDGELPMEHVIVAARDSGVEALLVTGHQHIAGRSTLEWQGYHDKVLLIAGTEISCRTRDHFLVFDFHEKIGSRRLDGETTLELLHRLGATAYLAHPQGRPWKLMGPLRYGWKHWDHPRITGLEIWSYMHDWIEDLNITKLPTMCRTPEQFITGPHPEVIRQWDRLAMTRHVAGIGALDTHGRQLPLQLGRVFEWAKDGILPYRQNFAAFSTYILTPERSGEAHSDMQMLLKALSGGQSWVAHDALSSGRDFRFYGVLQKAQLLPGTEVDWQSGLTLHVESPVPAQIRILSRGVVLAETTGEALSLSVENPGEYRVEADIDGAPWIRTNHLYVRGHR